MSPVHITLPQFWNLAPGDRVVIRSVTGVGVLARVSRWPDTLLKTHVYVCKWNRHYRRWQQERLVRRSDILQLVLDGSADHPLKALAERS
jgi:hypothetical protein